MKTALRASRRSTVSQRLKRGFSDNVPRNFAYTGAAQTTVVPAGALSAVVNLYGASGGTAGGFGGKGGRLQARIPVTPGETLQINVGGMGTSYSGGGFGGSGWNGGGGTQGSPSFTGAGGGGATDIRRGGTALANRVAVAAGGGGNGGNQGGNNTGHGGGLTGAAGLSGGAGSGGGGATQSAGGTGGALEQYGQPGIAGSLGSGGNGGNSDTGGNKVGGGGGGGYYGGGGGGSASNNSGGGGGGGSNYATPAAIEVTHTQGAGANAAHGSAIITFSSVPVFDPITFAYTGAAQTTVVPVGALSAVVDLQGAAGGAASNPERRLGGRVQARIPVTPGETLQINVGGQGSQVQGASASGGWNGGGGTTAGSWGMSGGGATDIRRGAFGLANRIVVAGGAGGAGYTAPAVPAGAGGGLTGQNGAQAGGGTPGQGGTQSAGGAAGTGGDGQATAGALGVGGLAGRGDYGIPGAGGGGYYGGGGATATIGNAGGSDGGGGSSYTVPESVEVVHTQGYRLGNGVATVTFSATPATPAPGAITTAARRGSGTMSGTGTTVQAALTGLTPGSTLMAVVIVCSEDGAEAPHNLALSGVGSVWTLRSVQHTWQSSYSHKACVYTCTDYGAANATLTVTFPGSNQKHAVLIVDEIVNADTYLQGAHFTNANAADPSVTNSPVAGSVIHGSFWNTSGSDPGVSGTTVALPPVSVTSNGWWINARTAYKLGSNGATLNLNGSEGEASSFVAEYANQS